MAIYLVDTSILIDFLNEKAGRKHLLLDLVRQGHMLASCPVTLAEIYSGMHPKDAAPTEALLSRLRFYNITPEISCHAGRLRYDRARKGQILSLADVLIASTALHYSLTLITANTKHFPMPGLLLHPLK